jgi:hypothetical protein
MEALAALLGWLTFLAAVVGTITLGAILVVLLQLASGAGTYGGVPVPSGVVRRADDVQERIRAHYRPTTRAGTGVAARGAAPGRSIDVPAAIVPAEPSSVAA